MINHIFFGLIILPLYFLITKNRFCALMEKREI